MWATSTASATEIYHTTIVGTHLYCNSWSQCLTSGNWINILHCRMAKLREKKMHFKNSLCSRLPARLQYCASYFSIYFFRRIFFFVVVDFILSRMQINCYGKYYQLDTNFWCKTKVVSMTIVTFSIFEMQHSHSVVELCSASKCHVQATVVVEKINWFALNCGTSSCISDEFSRFISIYS